MTDAKRAGNRGEALAAKAYLDRGCRLLAHNFRTRMGELDLVLEHDDIVIICEVKLRGAQRIASPAASVDAGKQRRLILAAQRYLQLTHQSERRIRFDVAEVTPLEDGKWRVGIIENAFTA